MLGGIRVKQLSSCNRLQNLRAKVVVAAICTDFGTGEEHDFGRPSSKLCAQVAPPKCRTPDSSRSRSCESVRRWGVSFNDVRRNEFIPLIEFGLADTLECGRSGPDFVPINVMRAARFQVVFGSWRLILLGSTGVVLSIASGWTTWDGMRNFTKEPLLSLMITFGIQGVMLIAAWLIGESFAAIKGRNPLKRGASSAQRFQVITGSSVGIMVFLGLGILLLISFNVFDTSQHALDERHSWGEIIHEFRFVFLASLVAALVFAVGGKDILNEYLNSFRVIIRNAVLWVIFLVCMTTSVFFSFDSLFSTIFSDAERRRAADLRTQSTVASLVSDLGALTVRRQLEQKAAFLRSGEWRTYAHTLDALTGELKTVPDAIDRYLRSGQQVEQEAAANRQATLAVAENERLQVTSRLAGLSSRIRLVQGRAETLASAVKRLNQRVFDKDREAIAKAAEAEAEARGIGVTSRVGRGPKYRELVEEHRRLKEEKNTLELQLRSYSTRLEAARKELADLEGRAAAERSGLSQLDIRTASARGADESTKRKRLADALRSRAKAELQRLERDRIAFEQNPTRSGMDALQAQCARIVGLISGSPVLTNKVDMSVCNPSKAHEAAVQLYALDAGAAALRTKCSAEEGLAGVTGMEPQIAWARSCLRLSGLPTSDVAEMRAGIDALERNRDDKAHRFIVTTNAFTDGNQLAYLALAIAIAIDALVFMSGLFGANAALASKSALPQRDDRDAGQLEAMIESALLPNIFENATHALETIKPAAHPAASGSDWTHELDLADPRVTSRGRLRKILNAGVAVGAVLRDPARSEHYLLRSEFIEFLHDAARRAFEEDDKNAGLCELKDIVGIALRPDPSSQARTILNYLHPTAEKDGYSSKLILSEVAEKDREIVRLCLNAAATLNCVCCPDPEKDGDRFLIHKDLYRVLALALAEPAPELSGIDREPAALPAAGSRQERSPPEVPLFAGPLDGKTGQEPDETQSEAGLALSPPECVADETGEPRIASAERAADAKQSVPIVERNSGKPLASRDCVQSPDPPAADLGLALRPHRSATRSHGASSAAPDAPALDVTSDSKGKKTTKPESEKSRRRAKISVSDDTFTFD